MAAMNSRSMPSIATVASSHATKSSSENAPDARAVRRVGAQRLRRSLGGRRAERQAEMPRPHGASPPVCAYFLDFSESRGLADGACSSGSWLASTTIRLPSRAIFTELHGTETSFCPTPSMPPMPTTTVEIRPSLGSIMSLLTLPTSLPLERTVAPMIELASTVGAATPALLDTPELPVLEVPDGVPDVAGDEGDGEVDGEVEGDVVEGDALDGDELEGEDIEGELEVPDELPDAPDELEESEAPGWVPAPVVDC